MDGTNRKPQLGKLKSKAEDRERQYSNDRCAGGTSNCRIDSQRHEHRRGGHKDNRRDVYPNKRPNSGFGAH